MGNDKMMNQSINLVQEKSMYDIYGFKFNTIAYELLYCTIYVAQFKELVGFYGSRKMNQFYQSVNTINVDRWCIVLYYTYCVLYAVLESSIYQISDVQEPQNCSKKIPTLRKIRKISVYIHEKSVMG
jgi:hypothetical protein